VLVLVYVHWPEVSGVWVAVGVFIWGNGTQFGRIDYSVWRTPLRRSRLHMTAFQLSMLDGREVWE